jgi:integrase
MTNRNQRNEIIKYKYRIYLAKAKGRDKKTWFAAIQHIHNFEVYTEFADFIKLNERIIAEYIDQMVAKSSLSYCDHNVKALKDFYVWLERQTGYKSQINYNMLAYFRLTDNQRKIARAAEYQESYELDDIYTTIAAMPKHGDLNMRNLAIVSLQILCGLRTSELRTVKMKNLIFDKQVDRWLIYVNPKDMAVKFAKSRHAFFMPFDNDLIDNVLRWQNRLKALGWADKDPLFPIVPNRFTQMNLNNPQVQKIAIRGNNAIIKVFKDAFARVNIKYLRPHSFRHTIVRWAESQTPELFNAVSQSLGHSSIKTTFDSYGQFTPTKIGNILNTSGGAI